VKAPSDILTKQKKLADGQKTELVQKSAPPVPIEMERDSNNIVF